MWSSDLKGVAGDAIGRSLGNRKMVALLADGGNAMFLNPHYVKMAPEQRLQNYDPTTGQWNTPVTGLTTPGKRAVGAICAAEAPTVKKAKSDAVPFGRTAEEIGLRELHLLTGCSPSSMPAGEKAPTPVVAVEAYGGTQGLIAPEGNRRLEPGMRILSKDKMPGDMWALGITVLKVLSNNAGRAAPEDYHDKKVLCDAELPCLWHTWLMKDVRNGPSPVPDEWLPALEFLKDLLELQPERRLTAAQALQHPFIKLADKFSPDAIPKPSDGNRRGRTPAHP